MDSRVKHDARFYFANLCVDVGRCVSALRKGDAGRYETHLLEAYKTLEFLRTTNNHAAYEEGQLLIRGLSYAHDTNSLPTFSAAIDSLTVEYAPLVA